MTFIIDSTRFRYPERPIVFLSVCYLLVGIAYVCGLGAGDTIACREPFPVKSARMGHLEMISTITQVRKTLKQLLIEQFNSSLNSFHFPFRVIDKQQVALYYL